MRKIQKLNTAGFIAATMLLLLASCDKENQNNLPATSPGAYEGKIDGFDSSGQVYASNLVAYWSFDNNFNELKTNVAPSQTNNASLAVTAVRGKSLRLDSGFLFYANQFPAFKTDSLKSFTISEWVQILNNGAKRTDIFQIARPGVFTGNLSFRLNTNQFPASNTTDLKVQPVFTTVGGGTQDNLNAANGTFPYTTAPHPQGTWVHLLLTYTASTGVFDIWINGIKAGAYSSRGVGNNLFKSYEPNQVIIGANYNLIPGMMVNSDVSFGKMTGNIDELRVYNAPLPDAFIKALYKLGVAGK